MEKMVRLKEKMVMPTEVMLQLGQTLARLL
jgi:hypothetical protein